MLAWIIYLTNPVLLWGSTLQHAGPPLEAQQGQFQLPQPGNVHHSTTIILKSYSVEPRGWDTRTAWAHWRRALLVRCYSTHLSTGFNNLQEYVLEQPWQRPELHLWDKLEYWALRLNSYHLFTASQLTQPAIVATWALLLPAVPSHAFFKKCQLVGYY